MQKKKLISNGRLPETFFLFFGFNEENIPLFAK